MLKKIAGIIFFAVTFLSLKAQSDLPNTNIYLFDIKQVTDSTYKFTNPKFLTMFNERGYNNQPSFFSKNELYITCQEPYSDQTDLYLMDLAKKTKVKITETAESEFSPKRMPDYYSFSAIRQEPTGKDTLLRLWEFPIDRITNGKPVFKYLTNIGYYHWINGYQVAVFVVDDPNYLAIASTRTDELNPIATNVGRCFQQMSNGNLVYVQKDAYSQNALLMQKSTYRINAAPVQIAPMLSGSEDFVIMPDGTFLAGRGSKIYKLDPIVDDQWIEIVDLSFYNIRKITRLAISPDFKIAIVTE